MGSFVNTPPKKVYYKGEDIPKEKPKKDEQAVIREYLQKTASGKRKPRKSPARESQLKTLNLSREFKNTTPEAFSKFCREAFGLSVDRKNVYNHKKKGFSQLKEHWKLKYLAFFHYLK